MFVHVLFMNAAFSLTIGSFLLKVLLLCVQLCSRASLLTVGASLPTARALLLTVAAFRLQWEVRLVSA